ncbi:hypothetical protein IAU60_003419 [Kwoniella sp. DSM 27419]
MRPALEAHVRTTVVLLLVAVLGTVHADSSSISPRWGHAAAYIPSPPSLIIQGGKTDPSSSYTYTNAPNTGETLVLPLGSPFSSASSPFAQFDLPSAATSAWHTLSLLQQTDGGWTLLSFGGDGGTGEALPSGTDSAWSISVNASVSELNFTHQGSSGQPMRRIHHSACSSADGGKVYISGGLKADGSGATFPDVYQYDGATSLFTPLPSLPVGLYHHTSILLPNGTLVIAGGVYTSIASGNPNLQPYSTLYSLDTGTSGAIWTERGTGGTAPDGRRGATLVLSDDGTKAFLYGGADDTLANVRADLWELDLEGGSWSQITATGTGPIPRYDHIAVTVGGNQEVIFGGYGVDGPADSDVHLWDMSSNTWANAFATPFPDPSPSSTASGKSGLPILKTATSSSGDDHPAVSSTPTAGSAAVSSGVRTPLATSMQTNTPTEDAGAHSHPLTTAIRVGLILGVCAIVATGLGLCLWAYKRRQRSKLLPVNGNASTPQYGDGIVQSSNAAEAEAGDAMLEKPIHRQLRPPHQQSIWPGREKSASIGLGMGAIGATLASISSKFAGRARNVEDPYAKLHDEPSKLVRDFSEDAGGRLRKSSRRIGNGIQLLGPQPQRDRSQYYRPKDSQGRPLRSTSIIRHSRIDMLGEEDAMPYEIRSNIVREASAREEDWVMPSDESDSRWKSAKSILNENYSDDIGRYRDPFEDADDEDTDGLILPPLRGGPVPTPHESRCDLAAFDETASMSNPYSVLSRNPHSEVYRYTESRCLDMSLPLASPSDPLKIPALLSFASDRQYCHASVSHSNRSGGSIVTGESHGLSCVSDPEQGIVQSAAYLHSQSPTLVSPGSPEYVPIKRSESFFRRMAGGGITSLLPSRTSSTKKREPDIRDPAPQPTLRPVISKDESLLEVCSPSTCDHGQPDLARTAHVLRPPEAACRQEPSLSSLSSARSMRDMEIVQKETTDYATESRGLIGRSYSLAERQAFHKDSQRSSDTLEADSLSPLPSETSILSRPAGAGHHRAANGLTAGLETPGEVVFNGADFASPALSAISPYKLAKTDQLDQEEHVVASSPLPIDPEKSKDDPFADSYRVRGVSHIDDGVSPVTPKRATISAELSPSPATGARRPVREVVESINKRGGSTPFTLLSPMSNYSPVPNRISADMTGGSGGPPRSRPTSMLGAGVEDPFASPGIERGGFSRTTVKPRPQTMHELPAKRNSGLRAPSVDGTRVSGQLAGSGRPATMWEVIRREQGLKVTNPDERKESHTAL